MKKTLKKFLPKVIGFRLNSLFLVRPAAALSKAYILFCSPRRGRVKPEQEDFLNTAKKVQISIEGHQIQTYAWEGKKERILLLHGWESNTYRWKELVEKLQEHDYAIYSVDAPAHGNSGAKMFNMPLYVKCIAEMVQKTKPDYIIGHSLGGISTLYHEREYGSTSKKIVLLGAPADMGFIVKGFQNTLALSNRFMKALEMFIVQQLGVKFSDFNMEKYTKHLTQKGLLIHDPLDKIVPFSAAKKLHANWKDATLITPKGAGHGVNNQEILKSIIAFLKA